MTDIYVSYALADQDRASTIVDALRGAGYIVWWDRDIAAASDRKVAIAEQIALAKLCLILWSSASTDPKIGGDVIDEAESAKAKGAYLGVLLDQVELPFGFGGYDPIDAAPFDGSARKRDVVVEAVRDFMVAGQSAPAALPPPPEVEIAGRKTGLIAGVSAAVVVLVALVAFLMFRSNAPTTGEIVGQQLSGIACSWLRVDPVDDGSNGTLGLTGVAGDPAAARKTVQRFIADSKLKIGNVSIDKVATIDPRECASIDEPIRLRKTAGGRLQVSGEPYVLGAALPGQALTRVIISLPKTDKSMALFGVEPSGVVTWALPDLQALAALKNADVGLITPEPGKWEFNIYTDHLGWTGLFLVVGDRPLAKTMPQGQRQSSRDFAATLKQATAQGAWDADMVWFRIDPK